VGVGPDEVHSPAQALQAQHLRPRLIIMTLAISQSDLLLLPTQLGATGLRGKSRCEGKESRPTPLILEGKNRDIVDRRIRCQ
jgi:hypothetical protein